jgi:serine protease AprX
VRAWSLRCAAVAALVASVVAVGSASSRPAARDARIPVIVVLRQTDQTLPRSADALVLSLRQRAAISQRGLVALLREARVPFRRFWITNALALRADQALIARLARRQDVAAIVADRASKPAPPRATRAAVRAQEVAWGVEKIGAPAVWAQGARGQGIVIGVADTGMQWDHPALRGHYRGTSGTGVSHAYNWHDAVHGDIDGDGGSPCGFGASAPCDDNGHGTFVTGIAAGGEGENVIGVAPEARWIGCRNMDDGVGRPSTYLECLQFFLAPTDAAGANPDPARRPDVVSNSYVCPPEEGCAAAALGPAVDAMRAAGIFMAVAAGNDGPSCSSIRHPPAIYDAVFTVGGTELGDAIRPTSSRGPVRADGSGRAKPDIVAPGTAIRSAYPRDSYRALSGTSAAAPHVAGAVALLWSAYPWLRRDVERTEQLLRASAAGLTTTAGCGGDSATAVPNNTFGAGRVQVAAAYDRARNGSPVAADRVAPVLARVRVQPRVARARAARALRFALSERGRVTIVVEGRVRGRFVARGRPFPVAAARGASAVPLRARVRGLPPGTYRLAVTPRDAAGNVGRAVRAGFVVRS